MAVAQEDEIRKKFEELLPAGRVTAAERRLAERNLFRGLTKKQIRQWARETSDWRGV